MTLQEIKDQYAKDRGFPYWEIFTKMRIVSASIYDIIAIRYAKAKLEEAAERAMVDESDGEKVYDTQKKIYLLQDRDYVHLTVNKESITDTPLD